MSDDSEEDGPEFSGIIQPPLIHQLKSILDQYPDDGQILKEIIQNAEDAEASEMKVLFDERCVNEDNGTKEKAFKKYFKGPALCVYNNAKFTEQDWQGIQMIYQSVKEFDPVKVGRFGLGFKSVFHITDYPMIISGGKLLVIDPHQKDPGKVCISMKLNRLHKCIKQMETTYCLDALNGLFGFSQETLDTGDFQGTIFRFPLRSSTSALSDNIYDAEKISDLFTAFESEASVELLFLKRLEKIELFRKSQGSDFAQQADSVFSVKIADGCLDDVRQKRSEFHNYMRQVLLSVTDETFTSTFNLTIVTETDEGESNKQDWLVIHCRKGRPLSEDLINLSQDESLSYSPYVSVAVPMVCDSEFIGHVFCLMPLPLENKSLTGYPVHVNGLFALDQNRRHVKWPSADQTKNKSHTDKPTRWNKCLVVEVLAYVYLMTLKELLRTCETSQFKQEDVDRVYRAIPDVRIITSNWDLIVEPLFRSLVEIPFLFTSTNGDKWILPSQAVFSIFDGTNDSEVEKSVLKLAKECGIDLVEAPEHIIYILKDRDIVVKTLSRDYIVNCLRSNPCYKSLSFDDKINILLYLVNGANFDCLNGLELLPLENGTFCSFGGTNKTYICHDKADLFPGQEASFLKQGINECVYTPLYKMAKQGIFQLCTLEDQPADVIASLLQRTLQLSIGDLTNTTVFWNQTGAVNNGWLKEVWIFMQRFSLSSFEHLHLIPDYRKNELGKPSKKFLLRYDQDHSISENISRCLEYFGIAVLENISDEIEQHRDTRKYILSPSPDNLIFMLGNVHGNDPVQKFNSSATKQERDELLAFLSKFNNFNPGVKDLIKDMALYTEAKSGRYVCTREVNRRVHMGSIPLQYFRESLSCPTADHDRLASIVDVPVTHEEDVIIDILSSLTREYTTADVNRMMDYVLKNHSPFNKRDAILNKARSIEFVGSVGGHLRRADELYDPEDDMAQSIIVDKSRFPDTSNLPVEVTLLRFIGLKSRNDIQADDVMYCAKYIENNPRDITSKIRSKAVITLLNKRPNLLQSYVNNNMLSNLLKNISFVKPCKKIENYPECLPWASEGNEGNHLFWKPSELLVSKFSNLIGSVKPILHESMTDLSGHFGCNQEPQPSDVICQLLKIADCYDDRYKPDVLPMISSIYKFLSNKDVQLCSSLSGHTWLWFGNGFETANKVYIHAKENDINTVPYMHPLPKEFTGYQQFFRKMGCPNEQSPELLINVQRMIREKYEKGGKTVNDAKADLRLVIDILNHLKDREEHEIEGILIPIKQEDDTKVVLFPVSECNYCRDEDELYGDEKHFVHQDITFDTAEKLGVPTVTDTLLEDAERLEEWGQHEPLTRRIKNLLESYKDGLSVPKEIIQNADDAGATKVCFMYDERDKEVYGRKLIDKNMLECQGPALWAFNDAEFSEEDLKNITKVSGATKQEDLSKIGKFGLGFCSVYNLTDVPSFVTGKSMVIFDPHYSNLGDALKHSKQPGLKVDFTKNRKILERKTSQFEPFNGVFGCDLRTNRSNVCFDGTLFRLPLRTRIQAVSSEISNVTYDKEQINSLMKIFTEAGGNLLLFTQNVSCIEFYYLPRRETNPANAALLYSVRRKTIKCIERPIPHNETMDRFLILKELAKTMMNVKNGQGCLPETKLTLILKISVFAEKCLSEFHINDEALSSSTNWMVAWASGTDVSNTMAIQSNRKGVVPIASVACPLEKTTDDVYKTISLKSLPLGYYRTSHVFCFLPLPVEVDLPVFINGSFAVTSDRRMLSCKTTDDKDSFESIWNEALLTDAVRNAYMLFLHRLNELNVDPGEPYYKMWPTNCSSNWSLGNFKTAFYRSVTRSKSNECIFRQSSKRCAFNKCRFLDTSILQQSFGQEAFKACVEHLENDTTMMIQLPTNIKNCFTEAGCNKAIDDRTLFPIDFYKSLVFPYLQNDVWSNDTFDSLMIHALEMKTEAMEQLIKVNECIPTFPNRLLRRPDELVARDSALTNLFSAEDERFLLLDQHTYGKSSIISTLCHLGMNKATLPKELLFDRAMSIPCLAEICSKCALDRCTAFIYYLEDNRKKIEEESSVFPHLQSINFLPARKKPDNWKWQWGGDNVEKSSHSFDVRYTCEKSNHHHDETVKFECPSSVFKSTLSDLVCVLKPILDKEGIDYRVCERLRIVSKAPLMLVFENLFALCKCARDTGKSPDELRILKKTVEAMYTHINKTYKVLNHDQKQEMIGFASGYLDQDIILLNGEFVKPREVVVCCSEDCSPHFYRLNSALEINSLDEFLGLLQIERTCSTFRIKSAMKQYEGMVLDDGQVKLYVRLLQVLVENLKKMEDKTKELDGVLIPDTTGVLRSIAAICFDEPNVNSTVDMHFTHDSISPNIAIALGISNKREQRVKLSSRDIDLGLHSQDFGQHEELTSRLQRILSGYPCDGGILKELVQNADDAQATEVRIVVDFNDHPTDKIFNDSWKPLQGPALLVCNDKPFTKEDLKGIQCLGVGSKSEDPTKTGQYGVGFNAVYHLTDVPSFLTRGEDIEGGECLCVLDPHCAYVPDTSPKSPGKMFFADLKDDYPDVFSCYHPDQLMKDKGTIFRLPLRSKTFASISRISQKEITKKEVEKLVDDFKDELMEVMLFVNNVSCIKISTFSQGTLKELYSVNLKNEISLYEYKDKVRQCSAALRQNEDLRNFQPYEVSYKATVTDSSGTCNDWLLVRRVGFSGRLKCPDIIVEAYRNKDLGLLPRGGVAFPLSESSTAHTKDRKKLFCFLPLPIETGLPVHCNGHFALDHESRRNLWTDENEGYRSTWNSTVFADIIAPAYVSALLQLKDHLDLNRGTYESAAIVQNAISRFFNFFPNVQKARSDYLMNLMKSIYEHISQDEIILFPSVRFISDSETSLAFYALKESHMTFPPVFNTIQPMSMLTSVDTGLLGTVTNVGKTVLERFQKLTKSVADSQTFQRLDKSKEENAESLVSLLQELGLKIIESPGFIIKGLEETKVEIRNTSPNLVIRFLKSFNTDVMDKCCLQSVDVPVSATILKSSGNVVNCLKYCMEEEKLCLDGVPLCLTKDGVLRTFRKESPVFATRFYDLVDEPKHLFLHQDLIYLFTSITDGIKNFTIDEFTSHLGESLQVERYRTHNSPVQWNHSGDGKPNLKWIHNVWRFLNRSVEKILSEKQIDDESLIIDQALASVMPWCLIPGRQLKLPNTDRSYEDVLFPVAHLKYILNLSDFRGSLQSALKKFLLPIIDGSDEFRKSTLIQHFVVSRESSIQSFLELLYYHRNVIHMQNLEAEQCRVILAHISGHLSAITEDADSEHFLEMIKELPIHVTVNGGHTCLRSASKFLVLDNIITDKICTSGLEEWASQSSTILIESNDATKTLYVTLGYTMDKLEAIDIYISHLLPKFDCLPRSAYNDHLCWIRDKLLAWSANSQFNKKQERLIEMLAHVRFVPDVHGTFRKASVFLSPFNELFKQFCSDDNFPCESFCKSEWRSMLELSGIRQTATQDQFLEFARQIERSSSINEDDKVKVNMLLRHIFSCKNLGNDFLVELSKIKFIIPIIVANWKTEIFAQSHTNLVCYSGSVMMQDADFVWTTCSILPTSAEPDYYAYRNDNEWQNIRNQLGLCSTPPIEKVVQHIQNVCDALKLMADDRNWDAEYVYRLKDLMKKIYKWIHGHTKHLFQFRDHLAPKPIVFLPEPRLFVTCDKCVRNLDRTEREIKPYLMQIPDEYGEYLDVFKWLGMDQDTSISTYVRVLMNLKMDVGNSELHVNEEKHVKLAVQRLFNLLRIGNKHDLDVLVKLNLNKLFLLTRNSTLEDASLTVYSDNIDYEEKIGHDIGMSYLMDFRKMEVTIPGIVSDTLKKLPRGMQPQILSEMITKELDEHNLSLVKHGKGVDVETFINSHYFIEAIVRIYVHSHKKTSSGSTTNVLSESDVEMLVAGVKRLTVVQVEQITLRLLFKNKLVGLSEKPCHFVQPSENEFVLYCVIDDENVIGWLIDNQTKFSDALKACTQGRFTDPYNHLSKILTRIYKPEDISRALDADDVKQYNVGHSSNESIFPTPGTVVHPNRHCYLFSSFYDYEPEEYVALLICEESFINDKYIPAEYIYAIVEKKIGTNVQTPFIGNALTEYELCVGGGKTERKKAYDLFKFKRNGQQRSRELVVFIDISESKDDDRDLNEILKEVRDQIKAAWTLPEDERRKIIKRLFKKWHPDKNLGKEELATEVFKFIKIYVLKMERGENIDETPDSRTSDTRYAESFFERAGPHSTFWSHFDNWEHETRNDTEQSHENDRGDGTSYRKGNRRQTSYDKVPSFHEANQWMRQAKLDFTAAQEFLPQACTGPHFNWVCFMLLKCVEKTLKALHLSIDCNNAMNTTDLLKLVKGLDQNVQTMVRSLVSVVGPCNNAMYPERLQLPKIPADMYTRDMAERARDISKNILDFADDTLSV